MANKEINDAYGREKQRLASAAKCFLEWKEPVDVLHMLIQHTSAIHAQFNALMDCLSDPSRRVDDNVYYTRLIRHLRDQVAALMVKWPEVTIDEQGRVFGRPHGLLRPR